MFKDKILAAFKLKYPGVNLSKTRLAAIATKIETKVIDDETKIDAALAAMDDAYAFTDIAKDDDRIRTLEAKIKTPKKEDETPAEKLAREQAEALAKAPVDDDTPAWAKALIKQSETLASDLAAIKGEKVANTIKSKLEKELLKDVPVDFWDEWSLPTSDEALPAFAEKVTTKFAAINQQRTEQGLSAMAAPKSSTVPATGKVTPASKEEVASIVDNIM